MDKKEPAQIEKDKLQCSFWIPRDLHRRLKINLAYYCESQQNKIIELIEEYLKNHPV